ncbi:MAG TPA: tyrosine-protein phosphatase [Planktothrix sp.]|jgi:protein tyrosine/serine phosphatase
MRKITPVALALISLITMSFDTKALSKTQMGNLPNFAEVTPELFRGGQPTDEGMSELKARGIKTIISLRHNHGQVFREQQAAESLGLKFVQIPVDGLHKISKHQISAFLNTVEDQANQPCFVHCEFGKDRTGTLVAIYREEAQQWSAKKAYDEMLSKGFESNYVWLADSVFDYEEGKTGTQSKERPSNVRFLDSLEAMIGTRPNMRVRND